MKKLLSLFLVLSAVASAMAAGLRLTSPDGNLAVTVNCDGGRPTYTVALAGTTFIESSPLGMTTDLADFTQGMAIDEAAAKTTTVSGHVACKTIKRQAYDYTQTEAVVPFTKDGKPAFTLTVRVGNNDVAYKYTVAPHDKKICCVIKSEATGFTLPDGTTTFLCPQAKPKTGFARTAPSYETNYTLDDTTGKNGWGEGFTFPCLFKVGEKGWAMISETGTTSLYCGCRLLNKGGNAYAIGFPQEGEFNGNGSTCPGLALPGDTPWRTITVGATLAPIVETTIAYDVVKPQYTASQPYVYGRGTWSWIIGDDASMKYDEQKRYIDFAHDMGYESILIDALWDSKVGRDKTAELVRYAATKGVGCYLWYNSNGYWNDAPQGPRGIMSRAIARKAEMKWMHEIGVRGIKVDFVGSDKQQTMQLYEDILSDANDYGIMVIYHGCTLPRGWEVMYPNFIASEAVLASENMKFGQGMCDNEALNATTHTFIRNTVAAMDFGGSTLNRRYSTDNAHGTTRRTSDVFALATAVLFQCAVQHFAIAPNNLTDAPKWAIDFMKAVPTTWDDVRFIDGYPGKYAVIARRHGDKWYVAGINAEKQPIKIKVSLPMFAPGTELSLYSDDAKLTGSVKTIKAAKKQQYTLTMPTNGGIVIVNK